MMVGKERERKSESDGERERQVNLELCNAFVHLLAWEKKKDFIGEKDKPLPLEGSTVQTFK